MKLTKLACVALSATIVFGIKAAAAEDAGYTADHQNLSFALEARAQLPQTYNPKTHVYTDNYKTVKLTNKDILALMAFLAQTTWPKGAQLEYDDISEQVIVADKTGNNVLFYCGDGVDNEGLYGYFDMDPYEDEGTYSGTYQDTSSGGQTYVDNYEGEFDLYIDDSFDEYANYMSLFGGGPCTVAYTESWNKNSDSGSHGFVYYPVATGSYNDSDYGYVTGIITGFESWSDRNVSTVRKHSKGHKH